MSNYFCICIIFRKILFLEDHHHHHHYHLLLLLYVKGASIKKHQFILFLNYIHISWKFFCVLLVQNFPEKRILVKTSRKSIDKIVVRI